MTTKPTPQIDRGTGNAPTAYDYSVPLPFGFGGETRNGKTVPKKFTDDQIRYIRTKDTTAKVLANEFDCSTHTIHCIRRRATYKNVS